MARSMTYDEIAGRLERWVEANTPAKLSQVKLQLEDASSTDLADMYEERIGRCEFVETTGDPEFIIDDEDEAD